MGFHDLVVEQDASVIPGAMQVQLNRALPDGGLIEFEFAPAGWLTKTGQVRARDWRAYHFTPAAVNGDQPKRTRYPSVTTLLDAICPKPGLPPWSEARGIDGGVEAVRLGLIDPHDPASAEMAVEIVRAHRLGADRARDDAAGRGLNIHWCLEHYMRTGSLPNPATILPDHFGYYEALGAWLLKADPQPTAVEELVCHPEDGYAGRLDLRALIESALTTVDAKTQENAGIYLAAHAQVNLYERAAVRCGSQPADRKLIVVFAANGEFREMLADHREAFTDAALAWIREARPVDAMCESANRIERKARKAVA